MELKEVRGNGPYISSYQMGQSVCVEGKVYECPIWLRSGSQMVRCWSINPTHWQASAFAEFLKLKPAVLLIGTGVEQCYEPQSALAELFNAQLGVELMTTQAACRTYNLLMAEGRDVVAALLL